MTGEFCHLRTIRAMVNDGSLFYLETGSQRTNEIEKNK